MKKRLLILSLTISMLISLLPANVMAAEKDFFENSIILLVNSPMCYANGEIKSVGDVSPTIINDRTLVPVRFLTESFGGVAEWNSETKTATLRCENTVIDVPVGENKIVINGEEKPLDVGATVISDRTMMPVRAISEALGKDVGYNDGIISLSDNDTEKYDANSAYSRLTMDAIRRQLSVERDGRKITAPTSFSFGEMVSGPGLLLFSEKDIPYTSLPDSYVSGGNIYIENLTIKEFSDTEHKMTFDAYNYDYVHGIVEVYDKDDNLIRYKMIEPFGGMWSSLYEYGVAVYNMTVGISNWISTGNTANITYRDKNQTQHTPIEITVPKNGYVHITANPGLSKTLCLYDVASIVTQSIGVCTSSVLPSKDSDLIDTFMDTLQDNITDTLNDAIISDPGLYAELINILSGDIDVNNSDASAKSLAEKIINLLTKKGLNIMDDAEETALKLFAESGEGILTKLASLFIDGGIGKALGSMSLINSASDYICFIMNVHYSTAKKSLIFRLCTDDLKVYRESVSFPGKTIYGTKTGLYVKDSVGENRLLASGNFEYVSFVTDGNDLYYHNKKTLSLNHVNVKTGKDTKISDVFKYFDTYFNNPAADWPRESCLSSGGIADYHDGKIYFEECGGFEIYPMCTIDINTKEYQLTPLRNIGRLGFYKDNMYYMKQTGSFDMWPMYIADTDGNNSRFYKNDVWKFQICDNMLYVCTGISSSYTDYDKGNLYRINLDTGKEELLAQNIKPSTQFENLVLEYHKNN